MPGGFPLGLDICNGNSTTDTSGYSAGIVLTAPSGNNSKGAWTQLLASAPSDVCFILFSIFFYDGSAGEFSVAVDVGVGASGSETMLIPNLIGQLLGVSSTAVTYAFPVSIAKGTRIAARYQASNGSSLVPSVMLITFDGAFTQMEGCAGADAVGFSAASTLGAAITAGGSGAGANTKGSYAQLTAATTRDYLGFVVGMDSQNANPVSQFLLDIAIGASGSEQIIVPNLQSYFSSLSGTTGTSADFTPVFIPITIPSGTRIAARCQGYEGGTSIGLTLYGVYQ